MRMFYQILMIFNLMIIGQTIEIKRYRCDTNERISEIHDLKFSFKRFIYYDNKIYFIFKERIVFTKLISIDKKLFKSNIKTILLKEFYEQKHSELDLPDSMNQAYKILGYFYDKEKNLIQELYFNDSNAELNSNNQDQFTTSDKLYDKAYELSFDTNDALAKRAGSIAISNLNQTLFEFLNDQTIVKFVNIIKGIEHFDFVARFSYLSKINENEIKFNELGFWFYLNGVFYKKIYDYSNIKQFVTYFDKLDQNSTSKMLLHFIGLKEDNFLIYFAQYLISIESITVKVHLIIKLELDFDELFRYFERF